MNPQPFNAYAVYDLETGTILTMSNIEGQAYSIAKEYKGLNGKEHGVWPVRVVPEEKEL